MDEFVMQSGFNVMLDQTRPMDESARQLAHLLKDTPEMQRYLCASREMYLDPEVSQILSQIRRAQMFYSSASMEDLQAKLEAQPAYQACQQAEAAVRELCQAVDQIISAAAGIEFAANAHRTGCG